MKKALHKTVDIICILLESICTIILLPFKLLKAILDIAKVLKREY